MNGTATANVANGAQIGIPVTLAITNGSAAAGGNVGSLSFTLTWDATKFSFVSGSLAGSCAASLANEGSAGTGTISIAGFTCNPGVTTTQSLYTLTLQAIGGSGTGTTVNAGAIVAADDLGGSIAVTPRGVTLSIP